uniref:Ig-like domain-containing protein n=1 Tax=Apteryx owenii TaxID=8824 RepID=A0A8B9P9T5_APTOW
MALGLFVQLTLFSPTPEPGPYLSLSPSHEVALGDKVTLQCHTPRQGGRAILHKEGVRHPLRYQDRVQGAAEFPITAVRREDAGRYWCQYEMEGEPPEKSEHVELYPRPHIFPSPGAVVVLGTHFTILCQGGHGATFLLHREGSSAPIQRQAPGGDLHGAKPPSPLSRSDTPRFSVPSDFTLGNTVRLGLGAGLLILLMLLVAEALHSWRRKGQGL